METRLSAGRVLLHLLGLVVAFCEVCSPIWAIFAIKPLEGISLPEPYTRDSLLPTLSHISPLAFLGSPLDATFSYISIAIAYISAFEKC